MKVSLTYVDVMAGFRELLKVLAADPILDLLDVTFLGYSIINGSAKRLRFLELNSTSAGPTGVKSPLILCMILTQVILALLCTK